MLNSTEKLKWMEIAAEGALAIFIVFFSLYLGLALWKIPIIFVFILVLNDFYIKRIRDQREKIMVLKEEGPVGEDVEGEANKEDVDYSYGFYERKKNTMPYFKVTVRRPSPGAFTIAREKAFDRFFVRLGVCSKIETHDPEFDNEFYITSGTPGFVRQLLNKPEKRRMIKDVFETGFTEIKDDGLEITAVWHNFPFETMEIKDIEVIVANLGALEVDTSSSAEPMEIEQTGWKIKRIIAFAIPIILIIWGIKGLLAGSRDYPVLDNEWKVVFDSLKYSIPLLIFYIWVAIQLLKGRSSSHKELVVVFFISIVVFIITGIWGEMYLNGLWDKNKPTVHAAKVIDKYIHENKEKCFYYATLESWRKGRSNESIKIKVDSSLYKNLKPGSSWIEVTTKPGKFGFEWQVGYKLQALEN